jgi:hypothetical protein
MTNDKAAGRDPAPDVKKIDGELTDEELEVVAGAGAPGGNPFLDDFPPPFYDDGSGSSDGTFDWFG